jgi:tRNA-modifying protein YgfZ
MDYARLSRYGVIGVAGEDARAFLHAQLTNDIANLPADRAALAGWCSAKGRLLASFLVIPTQDGFLLQLARDLVPAIAKRLSMFVLRSKVRVIDETARYVQFGVWGALPGLAPGDAPFALAQKDGVIAVRSGESRILVLAPEAPLVETQGSEIPEQRWTLEEIRAGRALITAATQDLFVPQMVNYEKIGAVNFQKGCYPGQEIVARAQYRGQVKRRMQLLRAPAGAAPLPGQDFEGGTVVDAAPAPEGTDMLVVLPAGAEAG